MRDTWRDAEGFGRPVEVEPRVWSAIGPDAEDHSMHCEFIKSQGVIACGCDATRKRQSEWWRRWYRWQTARSSRFRSGALIKWPVTGPDGTPWIPGIDFNE